MKAEIAEKIILKQDDVTKLLSDYLSVGRKSETWVIDQVEVVDSTLIAHVRMSEFYVSDTDSGGFHLTIFSTLEFLSQLMIVYGYVWTGFPEKTQEGWMVESHTKSVRAIRNPNKIRVDMDIIKMRRIGENIYCVANYRVTDDQDGLFEVTLKGFLA